MTKSTAISPYFGLLIGALAGANFGVELRSHFESVWTVAVISGCWSCVLGSAFMAFDAAFIRDKPEKFLDKAFGFQKQATKTSPQLLLKLRELFAPKIVWPAFAGSFSYGSITVLSDEPSSPYLRLTVFLCAVGLFATGFCCSDLLLKRAKD
jgi:hypothetical protein